MPKTKISEFSSTPANNTDIDSINIAEGCAPSGINDAIRELMAQLKDWQSGTSNDPYVVGSSGSLTLNQGTANGVAYLNGSKVVTSGSALTYDGTTLSTGGNFSLAGAGTGARYVALLNETNTYAGSLVLQAGGGSAGFGGGVTMYGANHSQYAGSVWLGYSSSTTNGIIFGQGGNGVGTEQMRLNGTGLGIGTTSPTCRLTVVGATSDATPVANFRSYTTGNDGDRTSILRFTSSNDLNWSVARYDAFSHIWNGSGSERARIDSSGNLLVGNTAYNNDNKGILLSNNGRLYATCDANPVGSFNRLTNDGTCINFYRSSSEVGYVSVTTTSTTYATSSDYRLKNTIAPMTGALAKVAQLKPVTYKWNADGSDGEGFIAHELAEVCPQAVTGEKNAVDSDGNPKYQGIDTSFLVATLTAAIQEQQAIIESLTTRITALEGQ
jgi:hypothetical protein